MVNFRLEPETQLLTVEDDSPTISVLWDKAVQQAVINTAPGPTIASRAYGMVHTAMFDAWATYDPTAISTTYGDNLQRPEIENTEANKQEAMSYAAYEVLVDLFPTQVDIFDGLMTQLGYDPNAVSTDIQTASGIGHFAAVSLLEMRHGDGSNQLGTSPDGELGVPYADTSGYQPINPSLEGLVDLEHWIPDRVNRAPDSSLQKFLTPHWGNVSTFALESSEALPVAPEPFLLVEGKTDFQAKTITLSDGTVVEINRSLIGKIINPEFITQAEEVIEYSGNLTEEQKLIAEFWEDGKGTSFPPGTWMSFGEYVSARDDNTLDEDAQMFFTLGNTVFDAGVAAWNAKVNYDYVRPCTAIRQLGELGLIGEYNQSLGGYAIEAWQPNEGTQTILARDFLTYQNPQGSASPPFAEYPSGHSTFSTAAAYVLEQFTGSDEFDAEVTFAPGESRFELGLTPSQPVTLEWDTFSEAANEAGMSRLYGGIHFEDGRLNGSVLGREVGEGVFEEAQFYINGGESFVSPEIDYPDFPVMS
jgi:hypothetical protein